MFRFLRVPSLVKTCCEKSFYSTKSLNLVFFGSDAVSNPTLQLLYNDYLREDGLINKLEVFFEDVSFIANRLCVLQIRKASVEMRLLSLLFDVSANNTRFPSLNFRKWSTFGFDTSEVESTLLKNGFRLNRSHPSSMICVWLLRSVILCLRM